MNEKILSRSKTNNEIYYPTDVFGFSRLQGVRWYSYAQLRETIFHMQHTKLGHVQVVYRV